MPASRKLGPTDIGFRSQSSDKRHMHRKGATKRQTSNSIQKLTVSREHFRCVDLENALASARKDVHFPIGARHGSKILVFAIRSVPP